MTKEKLKEIEAIYEQKRATCYWVEAETSAMVKRAWAERQEAFHAWQKAVNELTVGQIIL
jgi:hypothetical protein